MIAQSQSLLRKLTLLRRSSYLRQCLCGLEWALINRRLVGPGTLRLSARRRGLPRFTRQHQPDYCKHHENNECGEDRALMDFLWDLRHGLGILNCSGLTWRRPMARPAGRAMLCEGRRHFVMFHVVRELQK